MSLACCRYTIPRFFISHKQQSNSADVILMMLRGRDLHPRPYGYEPHELLLLYLAMFCASPRLDTGLTPQRSRVNLHQGRIYGIIFGFDFLSKFVVVCCSDSSKRLPQSDGMPLFYLTNSHKGWFYTATITVPLFVR